MVSLTLRRLTKAAGVVHGGNARETRPRWDGAVEEMFWGLTPLVVMVIAWQACVGGVGKCIE